MTRLKHEVGVDIENCTGVTLYNCTKVQVVGCSDVVLKDNTIDADRVRGNYFFNGDRLKEDVLSLEGEIATLALNLEEVTLNLEKVTASNLELNNRNVEALRQNKILRSELRKYRKESHA